MASRLIQNAAMRGGLRALLLLRTTPTSTSTSTTARLRGVVGGAYHRRCFSNMLDIEDDLSAWPLSKTNTVLNVCPQATSMVVERLGKFHSIHFGGRPTHCYTANTFLHYTYYDSENFGLL